MNLNNINKIKELDTGMVAESISALPFQVRQVLHEARLIKIPGEYSKVTQAVVNGMGGSNIGAGIVKSVFSNEIKVPISITPGYGVPAHVNDKTLYVVSSYSGTTEEPLSAYGEAKKRGAKIMAITSHGAKNKLEKIMIKDNIPGYIFKPEHNPSGQPRLGLGYSIFGMAVMMAKAGLFKIDVGEAENVIASLEIWDRELRPAVNLRSNAAKQLALKLPGKQIVLAAAEFLIGNVRAMRNQFCENSKHFATYLALPDLNHFAMEGLANPKNNKKDLVFLFFDSELYHPRVQKRSRLTKEVIKKNGIEVLSHNLTGKTKLAQAFEMLQLGSWTTYYLGMLNKVNPVKIPWVDWFKKELGK
jgi:glucose/mannose-6-phosphate isomerase